MVAIERPDFIIIGDDFVRKNRRADGSVGLVLGRADKYNKRIVVYKYAIDENITLLNSEEIEKLAKRISLIDEQVVIAHEAQHIHNGAIGYNSVAVADNIYESMMLALADEMSAMLAGFLKKNKDVDLAFEEMLNHLSGEVRQSYIRGQFLSSFKRLQQIHGNSKKLYKHKFDLNKISNVLKFYFTIDGSVIMNKISQQSKLKFANFMVSVKADIKKCIGQQIALSKINQKEL